MEKAPLDNLVTKNKGKAVITAIKYSAPDRAMFFSFYNHPQPLWVWVDGTSISLEKLNLHVDVGGRVKASIKREVSNPERRLGKKAKNQSLPGHAEEKDFLSKHGSPLYEHHGYPPTSDQGLVLQTHALQMILFGPSLRTSPVSSWGRHELSPYNF